MEKKRMVVIGAGFAGVKFLEYLSSCNAFEIILIDENNFHQFQPLFYQVASGRLEPSSISFPLRKLFQRKYNIHVRVGKVESIDTTNKQVITINGTYTYDYLVIATGCTTNYFGNKNIEQHAFPMKSTPQAIALRNKILLNFEESVNKTPEERVPYRNIVIVGGGPTGVELAGALAELRSRILPKDYPDIDFSDLKIYLIESSPNTLGVMSQMAQQKSREYLEKMGVNVWTNNVVSDYDGKTITLKNGRTLLSNTVVWAAGIKGNVPESIPQDILVRGNRIPVDECHAVKGLQEVYVLGDVSYMETPGFPKGHPQLANVANSQAVNLAHNFRLMVKGKQPNKFVYKSPGTMATVGKRKAIVDMPKFSFSGRIAWFVWMFLHLMLILSAKNKLFIFFNWMISYFTNDSTLRVIMLPSKKQIQLGEKYLVEDAGI